MKKSEHYMMAMKAVLREKNLSDEEKIEVLETLTESRNSALWSEEREAKEAE